MAFQLSPGVNVSEIDLTTVIPAVSTTNGAIAGVFRWGPIEKPLLVTNENQLRDRFGKPTSLNAETFFTAASFLAYSNALYVARASHLYGNTFNQTLTLETGNTTLTGITNTDITVGDVVFGEGILENTVVEDTIGISNGEIVISKAPVGNGATELQFFDSEYSFNAITNTGFASLASHTVKNEDHYDTAAQNFESDVQFVAKYPGELGNSLKISVCDSPEAFESTIDLSTINSNTTMEKLSFVVGSNTATLYAANTTSTTAIDTQAVVDSVLGDLQVGDLIRVGDPQIGYQFMKISHLGESSQVDDGGATGESVATIQFDERYVLSADRDVTTVERFWSFWELVDQSPTQSEYMRAQGNTAANDELHVVVVDEDGKFSGVPGTVLEVFESVSRAIDAKTTDGASNYFKDVINDNSRFVWYANDISGAESAMAEDLVSSTNVKPYDKSFIGGRDTQDERTINLSDVLKAYDVYKSPENIDISLVLTGKSRGGMNGTQVGNYIIDNITSARKDCVAFVSPEMNDVVGNTFGDIEQDVVQFRNSMRSTSYAVMDCGYKYMFDKYNGVYRWVPLNGDIAGLCAYTDDVRDAWWSPAGLNRGNLKNVIKLAWNPNTAQRDFIYKNGVNPVVNFPGQGIVLYGDKTLLDRPSAFDRINVRRLFIVLEKAIAAASQSLLFEFNDEFTRASFVNLVTPFLRDVQGRRGIYEFHVVADETNNTGEVIDRNEFVGDIYIKPARSINFIQLNFVAVRTGVEFEEVIGNF